MIYSTVRGNVIHQAAIENVDAMLRWPQDSCATPSEMHGRGQRTPRIRKTSVVQLFARKIIQQLRRQLDNTIFLEMFCSLPMPTMSVYFGRCGSAIL